MSGINKAILVGRLGNNPEIRYTPSGAAVSNFNIATSEVFKDKSGQKQERTEWHRIVVWGKMAETCAEYLTKGRQVYIEGRLQTRSWDDKEGRKRYTTEIVATTVQFLGNAPGAEAREDKSPFTTSKEETPGDFIPPTFEATASPSAEEDIPF